MAFSPETFAMLAGRISSIANDVEEINTVFYGGNNGKAVDVTSSFSTFNEVTLQAGTYLVCANGGFGVNSPESFIQLMLYNSTENITYLTTRGAMYSGGGVCLVTVITLTAQAVIRTRCAQTTGNTIASTQNNLFAIKL